MIDTNAMLLCDTYKQVHINMFDKGLTKLVSYWVPRKSMFEKEENQKMVFFGLQAFIQEFLIEYFNDNFFNVPIDTIRDTYRKYMNVQLGEGNYSIKHIEDLHKLGYLPLSLRALPEGSKVNMGVPCISLTNTNEDFAWLVQWVECILQAELWKTCNHATIGNMYYKLAKYWYDKNVDNDIDPRNAFSDFGMRGMSSINEASRCSAAWLLSANKTSTVCALPYIDKFYDADCSYNHIGQGAISTEHAVISSNYAHGTDEVKFLKRMLTETYPNASFSCLGDTYDYWNFIDNVIPSCKDEIMKHNGKLLVRPDSGDQFTTVIKTVQKLWDTFGGTVNTKGFKVLDSHIGIILGDGCTLNVLKKIWDKLNSMQFAANNVIFGVGAFCFTAIFEGDKMIVNTRDTYGVAMKATYACFGVKEYMVYKDPKTDTSNLKKSHKGLVFVYKDGNNFMYKDGLLKDDYNEYGGDDANALRLVFEDGKTYNRETFTTIRERLNTEE